MRPICDRLYCERMDAVNVSDLRDQIDSLLARVEAGEVVEIARDGQAVARVTRIEPDPVRKPIDVNALRRLAASLPFDPSNAADIVRRMRDDARY